MKYFISFLLAVFVFYSVGTEFVSATANQNFNEEELIDTDETPTETIDSDQIDSETEEIFRESIDGSNVKLESDINGKEATIQTNIETDDLSVDGELELDLDTSSMVVSAEAEDDSAEVFNGKFKLNYKI
ncbi:hypothetical protein I33_2118 [Bacillus subtilis subsp. subtilis str. RO-NN-1]|nr:hypothetical protein I33_2118 [Bacillus subtilis subsp. subtilis str. RO-NN-1]